MRLGDAGLRCRQTNLLYPNHRLRPWLAEVAPHDRSNRLLDVSRTKVNWRAVCNNSIEFLNLWICDRDTSNRPIRETVRSPDPTETIMHPVNHDLTARIVPAGACPRDIGRGRVGNMKRSME
jgi:hypothetical protein